MSDLAMAYLTLGDIEPFAMVQAAAEGGFAATALRLTGHAPGDEWPFDPSQAADRKRMRMIASQSGIKLQNASTYRFGGDRSAEEYRPILDCCAQLGIETITANSFDGDVARVTDLMAGVAEQAKPMGIRLAIEFIPTSQIKTAEQAKMIALATGMPNVGLVIDALHLWRSGGSPATIAALPQERVFAVQLCDAPLAAPLPENLAEEMRAARLLPGEGELDLQALMKALPAVVEVEIETPNARFKELRPSERARIAFEAGSAFLKSTGDGARAGLASAG